MSAKPPLRFFFKSSTAAASNKFSTTARLSQVSRRPRKFPASTSALPKSTPSPSTPGPAHSQWHPNPVLQSSARYLMWSGNIILGLCAFVWFRDQYVEIQRVSGSSMAPTLNPTTDETGTVERLFMRPYVERLWQKRDDEEDYRYGVQRGDVVMFWKPHKPEEISIKRVVAIEGDTVYPARGYSLQPSSSETRVQGSPDGLADHDPDAVLESEAGKVIVPYGHIWVEGDNWRKSWDSNDFGPISRGLLLGKAFGVWRSWLRIEEIGDSRIDAERAMRSRVVKGTGKVPAVFLE